MTVFALPALFFLLVLPFFALALVALAASQLASGVGGETREQQVAPPPVAAMRGVQLLVR